MHRDSHPILVGFGLLLLACALSGGCSRANSRPPSASPPPVTVSHPLQCEVTDFNRYTGRTAAIDSVQVTARVTGYLDKIYFKDGDDVDQGALLYEIDPRPYQAQHAAATAQLAQNQANLGLARANVRRFEALEHAQPGAVAATQLDQYRAQEKQAIAAVDLAKANLQTAALNLGWTKVYAPISGRLSRTLITRGNLVVADQTALTNIVSQDPMYVYFDVDEPTALSIQQLQREGKFKSAPEPGGRVPIELGLANEEGYPHAGHVDFVNNQLNTATATLQFRAVFANPRPRSGQRLLSPGLFVRIQMPASPPYQALLVVEDAIQTDQTLRYVDVVGDGNRVDRREVTQGTAHGGLVVVTRGLAPDDRVIIRGLQHVRTGMTVQPALAAMPIPSTVAGSGVRCANRLAAAGPAPRATPDR